MAPACHTEGVMFATDSAGAVLSPLVVTSRGVCWRDGDGVLCPVSAKASAWHRWEAMWSLFWRVQWACRGELIVVPPAKVTPC
jgi:hypothetical protein